MFHVNCLHIPTQPSSMQDHLYQPKLVQGTTFSCQKWSPGPILFAKFGDQFWQDGTIFGNQKWSPGPILFAKFGDQFWQDRTLFGNQKWSPGPILVAKFGPARASFGKIGPFLTTKIGPGDHFWVGHLSQSMDTCHVLLKLKKVHLPVLGTNLFFPFDLEFPSQWPIWKVWTWYVY